MREALCGLFPVGHGTSQFVLCLSTIPVRSCSTHHPGLGHVFQRALLNAPTDMRWLIVSWKSHSLSITEYSTALTHPRSNCDKDHLCSGILADLPWIVNYLFAGSGSWLSLFCGGLPKSGELEGILLPLCHRTTLPVAVLGAGTQAT